MRRHLWGRALPALLLLTVACGSKLAAPQQVQDQPADPANAVAAGDSPVMAAAPGAQVEQPPAAHADTARQEPAAAARTAPRRADPSVQPQIAIGARRLARQILAAEGMLRDSDATEDELAVAGHTLQLAYRELSERWRLESRVLERLPRALRPIAHANVRAYRELAALSDSKPPTTLPAWRIVEPAPRRELKRYYRKAERVFGVPWEYLAAINLVETRMGRIRGVSTAGAQGPMQFIPTTWAMYGRGDVNDNHDAIMAAARYLKARGAPRDMSRALYSYNNSMRYVRAVAAHAEVMRRDARAYRGYYHWQVYYRQPGGPVWLPVGYNGK